MFKALSEGHRAFTRMAIVADTETPTPPCGACRQILWEFGGSLEITRANMAAETGTHRLSALLPLPFDARLLLRIDNSRLTIYKATGGPAADPHLVNDRL